MSRGRHNAEKQVGESAAKAEAQAAETPKTPEAAPPPSDGKPTPEQLESFVSGIQADLKAGNYDQLASLISEMSGAKVEGWGVQALVNAANAGSTWAANGLLSTVGIKVDDKQLKNIANLSTLDQKDFISTIEGLAGGDKETMDKFYERAAKTPIASSDKPAQPVAEADKDKDSPPSKRKSTAEDFDFMRFLSDETYQQEQGSKFVVAIANLEKMAEKLMSSNSPMGQTMGKLIGSMLGFVKPMLESVMGNEAKVLSSPDGQTAPEATGEEPVAQAAPVDDREESIRVARAAPPVNEQFSGSATQGYPYVEPDPSAAPSLEGVKVPQGIILSQ